MKMPAINPPTCAQKAIPPFEFPAYESELAVPLRNWITLDLRFYLCRMSSNGSIRWSVAIVRNDIGRRRTARPPKRRTGIGMFRSGRFPA